MRLTAKRHIANNDHINIPTCGIRKPDLYESPSASADENQPHL